MKRCDVVFLVPGFLGFERFEDYAYFAERCAVTLRAILSEGLAALVGDGGDGGNGGEGHAVRVVPVPIPPTASLAVRQRALGKTLVHRAQAISRSENLEIHGIHLVGHSTGGVDAELLTYERPLAPQGSWSDFDGVDVEWLRARLRSVVCLASPHQGTCLALDPIARMLVSGDARHLLGRVTPAIKELLSFVSALPGLLRDAELPEVLVGVLQSNEGRHFLHELWKSRDLIADLTPQASALRRLQAGARLQLLRRSFVTIAGVTPSRRRSALESMRRTRPLRSREPDVRAAAREPSAPPDALFLLLASLTAGEGNAGASPAPLLSGSVERLAAAASDPTRVICATAHLIPQEIDAAINDGIVNSARQLIDPTDPQELAAVVIADHFDVVGHYDRTIWVTDPQTGEENPQRVVSGLLHSGSEFRDNEFFALFHQIGACLAPRLLA